MKAGPVRRNDSPARLIRKHFERAAQYARRVYQQLQDAAINPPSTPRSEP